MQTLLAHPWIIVLILLWTLPWKGAALWRSARRAHMGWFLTLLVLNTFAVLDILYLFYFSKPKKKEEEQEAPEVRQPRVQNFQSDELLQKQMLEKQRIRQELEAKQARYTDSKKRLTIL